MTGKSHGAVMQTGRMEKDSTDLRPGVQSCQSAERNKRKEQWDNPVDGGESRSERNISNSTVSWRKGGNKEEFAITASSVPRTIPQTCSPRVLRNADLHLTRTCSPCKSDLFESPVHTISSCSRVHSKQATIPHFKPTVSGVWQNVKKQSSLLALEGPSAPQRSDNTEIKSAIEAAIMGPLES